MNKSNYLNKSSMLIILFSLIFYSCGSRDIDKANKFIEIKDYSNAIIILVKHIIDNPKDFTVRQLLAECYDNTEQWNKEIEQLIILSNLHYSVFNDYKLMRLYAQTMKWTKLSELKQRINTPDDITEEYFKWESSQQYIDLKNRKSILIDSLHFAEDSIYTDKMYKDLADSMSNIIKNYRDSICIDYYTAIGLYELNKNDDYSDNYFYLVFEDIVNSDTTYRKYITIPILEYLSKQEKPKIKYYYPESYNSDMQNYHNIRAKLYEIIGYYDEALNEYDSGLFWYSKEQDTLIPAYVKYWNKIDLLKKIGNYQELINTAQNLKILYGEIDEVNIRIADMWIKEYQEKVDQ